MPPSRLLLVLCASLGGMFGETARAEPSAPGETVVTLIPATDAMLAVERARERFHQSEKENGAEHSVTQVAQRTLGLACEEAGLYAESEKEFRGLLAIQERILGRESAEARGP